MNTIERSPFRIEGVVEPPYFTDRAEEVGRIRRVLGSPPSKLLVYGARRMGKSSALHVARGHVEREGGAVVFADLSTASSPADMANRLLEAASRALGRSWRDFVTDVAERLRVRLQLVPDPATGLAVPTVEAGLRTRDVGEQVETFVGVLDALESMASARDAELGVILDEFQEISRLGGESAEWRLRGAVQTHRRLSYVLAGSDESLIRQMVGPNRAFYELFELLHFGPMEASHLSRWIDERLEGAGAPCPGVGERVVAVAGDRTRDVVRLARAAWEVARSGGGDAPAVVRSALGRVVAEEDDRMRVLWDNLTELQQNVLRAVAWNGAGLSTRETLERFGLGYAGTARNSALALEKRGLLRKSEVAVVGWEMDSPFTRAWLIVHALPDAGVLLPADHTGAE